MLLGLTNQKKKTIVGHIKFCSGIKRSASVKARDFVTAYEIDHKKFMESLQTSSFEEKVAL